MASQLLDGGQTSAFSPNRLHAFSTRQVQARIILFESEDDTDKRPSSKTSLEDKMKNWETTEAEQKASSLGGVVPGRADAFDVGLYIAFPLMVIASLAFAVFPLIMDKIDVSSVGPPPTT